MRSNDGVSVSHAQTRPSRPRASPFGRPVSAIVSCVRPSAETFVIRPRSKASSATSQEPSASSNGASGNPRSVVKMVTGLVPPRRAALLV